MKILDVIPKLMFILFRYGNLTFLDFDGDDRMYFPVDKIIVYPKAKIITMCGYSTLEIGEKIPRERVEYIAR
jgi:hypothetical protein